MHNTNEEWPDNVEWHESTELDTEYMRRAGYGRYGAAGAVTVWDVIRLILCVTIGLAIIVYLFIPQVFRPIP